MKKIWNDWLLPRISGNFSGTSDEILQWAAAKWGLPDNVLRAQMMVESQWHQATVGDCTTDQPSCPPGYTAPCPLSFGVLQVKTTPAHGGVFPHNRDSTAFNLDYAAAVIRGCYEGWEEWLRDWGYKGRGEYAAGDLWGCVGRWYSGDWHTDDTEKYLAKVRTHLHKKSWLSLQAPRGEVGLLASR